MLSVRKQSPTVLLALLALLLVTLACVPGRDAPTSVVEVAGSGVTTEVPTAEVPAETPTPASVPPTPTVPPAPTSTPLPASTAPVPPATQELAIQVFTVATQDMEAGKRLKFTWETTGASIARIVSGTSQRFARWWDVPPSGTLTVELPDTNYRDPTMALMAQDEAGNEVIESIKVDWPCRYDYFFEPAPIACPLYEPTYTWAAEQAFQNGRAIWLEEILGAGVVTEGVILVLYDDGRWQSYHDTWTSAEPETDPEIVSPEGLYQPTRGFGKLWRESEGVREELGWALSAEQGFESAWQWQAQESLPAVAYVRTMDGRVIRLYGSDSGNWEYVTP